MSKKWTDLMDKFLELQGHIEMMDSVSCEKQEIKERDKKIKEAALFLESQGYPVIDFIDFEELDDDELSD